MRYSDWQLGRLRDALRAYHRYGRGADGSYFNWKDVSEAIAESTDVAIPPERLRQFVEGINAKDGGRKFPVPQDEWLAAIVGFATDEDNDLLSADELEEPALPWQAARRLLDYLDQAFDTERIMPPESLAGRYVLKAHEGSDLAVITITLQRPSEEGLLQVLKTEEFYQMIAPEAYEEATPEQRRSVRESEVRYGGWAILTPEDNLLIFLKKEHNGLNRYYLTLASDLSHAPGSQVSRLVLLHHDYPLEPEEEDEGDRESMLEAIHEEARRKIMLFERID